MNLYLCSVCVCECVVLARCFAVSRHLAVHIDDLQTAYLWLADRSSLWDSPTITEKGFLFSSACITLFHTPLTPFSNSLLWTAYHGHVYSASVRPVYHQTEADSNTSQFVPPT